MKILMLLACMLMCIPNIAVGQRFSSLDKETTEASSQAMSSNHNHDITVSQWDKTAIQIVWTTADAADATVKLQASVDGTNFEDWSGSTYTIATAAGNHWWSVETHALRTLRVVYSKGSNTTGTYTLYSRKEIP